MRRATDDEIERWQREGWVLVESLVPRDIIDGAVEDVWTFFPRPERFHRDPARYVPPGRDTATLRRGYPEMPEHGPWFRPEQHRWGHEFPFMGTGALNRLYVHPALVDFAERALGTRDLRIYQAHVSGRYTGDADYEQPMHTDRNHSFLPAIPGPPWHHVEMFVYLTDVDADCAPTHALDRTTTRDRDPNDILFPDSDPAVYKNERAAVGPRGSLMAYRNDVFHRGVNITRPQGARFLMVVGFKRAGVDWIGYHAWQSRATHPGWTRFVEESTPRELELFGFPTPGDPIWTPELLDATQVRYPGLDLEPWRSALTSAG
ncbi:MAG TPA: hypothetical protein VFR41_03125 [Acidimicrobiia bacterium]|nr:hypothetical protein [Acidimicrobiia bacterium]